MRYLKIGFGQAETTRPGPRPTRPMQGSNSCAYKNYLTNSVVKDTSNKYFTVCITVLSVLRLNLLYIVCPEIILGMKTYYFCVTAKQKVGKCFVVVLCKPDDSPSWAACGPSELMTDLPGQLVARQVALWLGGRGAITPPPTPRKK